MTSTLTPQTLTPTNAHSARLCSSSDQLHCQQVGVTAALLLPFPGGLHRLVAGAVRSLSQTHNLCTQSGHSGGASLGVLLQHQCLQFCMEFTASLASLEWNLRSCHSCHCLTLCPMTIAAPLSEGPTAAPSLILSTTKICLQMLGFRPGAP